MKNRKKPHPVKPLDPTRKGQDIISRIFRDLLRPPTSHVQYTALGVNMNFRPSYKAVYGGAEFHGVTDTLLSKRF